MRPIRHNISYNNHGKLKFLLKFYWFLLKILTVLLMFKQNAIVGIECSLAMKRLYEDLFTDYNRLILPLPTNKTKVTINLGLKLGQILDLNLKQQILSTNVWVEQTWYDYRLEWDAQAYDGIDMIHVPAENIWIPDIVLFNNADGNYELTLVAKAVLYSNGSVVWKPPTMFRSTCEIDVEYFPFDIQTCFLRFGSWTYAGDEVEIKHIGNKRKVDIGIDLSQFYKNVEWDIIDVPAYYNDNYYECCTEPYPDITFKIVIRRKMLFYLVNLILPVALMTFMTVSVFYLPADSNEKVTLSISILTSLIVFFLLMLEVIPPTSLAVPLFGKYLLFTLVLVSLSACVSVYVLNIYHRAPSVHQMSPRMRQLFLKTLPRLLRLDRPDPRERSSLNRFRKKKIAQQILQARQHNKIYDLAQPLAASLNLIDTLQKSYTFNTSDDTCKLKTSSSDHSEGEEEGRYFRRYVDNYIEQLEAHSNSGGRGGGGGGGGGGGVQLKQSIKKGRDGGGHFDVSGPSSSQTHALNRQSTMLNGHRNQSSTTRSSCCEHKRCCSNANKPLRQTSSSSASRTGGAGAATAGGGQFGQTCCSANCDWVSMNNGATTANVMRSNRSPMLRAHGMQNSGLTSLSNYKHDQSTSCTGERIAGLHDDTFDMTFDYDDQDNNNNNNINFESMNHAVSGHLTANNTTRSGNNTDEVDLPSPPPPPRQLTQLSDSLKDLSGRLSSCSQQKLIHTGHGSIKMGRMDSGNNDDEHQRLNKLINNINLINSASIEIDATTTTSSTSPTNNNDEEYLQLKAMANSLNNSCSIGLLPPHQGEQNSFNEMAAKRRHQPSGTGVECTCSKLACQNGAPSANTDHTGGDSTNLNNNNTASGQRQTSYSQPQQRQPGQTMIPDSLAGTNAQIGRPSELLLSLRLPYDQMPAHVRAAIRSILFIADTIKNEDDENSAIEDWESMSMVVDRLFLWIFFLLCTFGSLIILALAPSLYDQRDSIDDKLRIEIPASNCSALHKNLA